MLAISKYLQAVATPSLFAIPVMDEREFSAIYESIEDSGDSDMEEYVTVSELDSYPGPYLCPEPKDPAPPPPGDKNTRKPRKSKKKQPHGSSHTSPNPASPQLPPKSQQAPPKYKRLIDDDSSLNPPKPRKLPKPGNFPGGKNRPAALPRSSRKPQAPPPGLPGAYHQLPSETSQGVHKPPAPLPRSPQRCGEGAEEENQYDSIKETRKMIQARKKYQKAKNAEESRTPAPSNTLDGDPDEYMKMETFSSIKSSLTGSSDDMLESSSGAFHTRVVCIILAITVTSLLIAVVSLVLALYGVVALTSHTRATNHLHCTTATMSNPPEMGSGGGVNIVTSPHLTSPPLNDTMVRGKRSAYHSTLVRF